MFTVFAGTETVELRYVTYTDSILFMRKTGCVLVLFYNGVSISFSMLTEKLVDEH